jgi:hypothetical protein
VLALTKVIRCEIGEAGASERSLSPEQIMDKLEERVGPKGRRLFEDFLSGIEQRLGLFQIARVKLFGKPTVDRS